MIFRGDSLSGSDESTHSLTHSLTHSVESQYLKKHVNTLNSHLVEKAKDIIRGDSLYTSHIFTPSLTHSQISSGKEKI